jgi:diguanylate cyclase (GGDEF)-like protein/PAS domain S-box-containing protein
VTSPELNNRLLIVDDNEAIHQDIQKILRARGPEHAALADLEADLFGAEARAPEGPTYEIDSAFQGREALARVEAAVRGGRPYALAFVDMRMPPGWDGVETIEHLWAADPDLLVVICTAYSDHSQAQIVARLGSKHQLLILKKPFDNAEVQQLACALCEKWTSSRQARLKLGELEQMVADRTAELRRSEERYALAAEGSTDGLWDWDLVTGRAYYSARWAAITGVAGVEPTQQSWLSLVHPQDEHGLRTALEAHLAGESDHLQVEHRLRHASGGYRWVLCRGIGVRDASGRPCRIAGSLSDITVRKANEDQLRQGAFYDRLTGLPNRALLRECLDRAIAGAATNSQHRYALLFLDLDRFKMTNDSLGHLAGDQLLVGIARRLAACLATEGPGPRPYEYTISRLGGDEFVVLLDRLASFDDARRATDLVRESLAEPFVLGGTEVFCTASIGLALSDGGYNSADDVVRDADIAMYEAKVSGRDKTAVFDASMRRRAVARLRVETDLRHAVERGELRLFYQPIVDVEPARTCALEALVRWQHPERGLVGPETFIGIAEDTGCITEVGRWVLRRACADVARWRRAVPGCSDLSVSVNLSGKQLTQGDLVQETAAILLENDLPPEALRIEVTESVIIEDLESAVAILSRFRDLGVRVYLDDFGTGYSSLSYLKKLPLDGLKIDRSFVFQVGAAIPNPAIIHAIVALARNLRMLVVAEGVETDEQMATVIALDCDMAQGFLFASPLPDVEVEGWLRGPGRCRALPAPIADAQRPAA